MGTRNLTVVIYEGKVKMAQYGQWDGYPAGVGKEIAEVLEKYKPARLRKAIGKCTFISEKEIEKKWKSAGADGSGFATMEQSDTFKIKYPTLSRDYSGGRALEVIVKRNGTELANNREFAKDSLFCEWAYVIDLDKEEVEVYKGFNQTPLTKEDRFFDLQTNEKEKPRDQRYFPVKLVKKFKMKSFTVKALRALENKLNKAEE